MGAKKKVLHSYTDVAGQSDQVRAAVQFGIDVQALIDNLERTPAERIRRHQVALDTTMMLRNAKYL